MKKKKMHTKPHFHFIMLLTPLFHRYYFSVLILLMIDFIKAILLQSNYILFMNSIAVICLMLLIKLNIYKSKKQYIKYQKELLLLIINLLVIGGVFFQTIKDENDIKEFILNFFNLFLSQTLFMRSFCYKSTEMFSMISFCLALLIKFEIQEYQLIYIIVLISLINFAMINKSWKNMRKKNCKFCQKLTNDLHFSLNQQFRVVSSNYVSNKSQLDITSEEFFISSLLKSQIFVRKEYSRKPEVKEMISDSLDDANEEKAMILEDYLAYMLKREEQNFFSLGKMEISRKNDLIYICKRKKKILLKIKRDKTLEEAINLKIITQNYAKAIYYTAHELRNPLNCITNLEFIDSNDNSSIQNLSNEFIEPAIISSKLMLNMVNGLLDLAQIEADTFKLVLSKFDLKVVIEEVFKIFRIQAKNRGAKIELIFDPKIKEIQSDPNRIKQIIINLLSNAIKYTKDGKITLKAQKLNTSKISISVIDTGIGIDENNLNKLFKAFSKIQNKEDFCLNGEGVGLGLTISNKLAHLLNKNEGGIVVSSKPKLGSEFSFQVQDMKNDDEISIFSSRKISKLPIYLCKLGKNAAGAKVQKNKINVTTSTSLSNKNIESLNNISLEAKSKENSQDFSRISSLRTDNFSLMNKRIQKIHDFMSKKECECPVALIIDDNDFNVISMMSHLKKLGMKCETALSGEIAMQKIIKMHGHYCCKYFQYIFIDLEMPEKNGLVIYKEISKYYNSLGLVDSNIVLNTGYSKSSEMVKEALRKGIKNILIKPITQMNLVELMDPM